MKQAKYYHIFTIRGVQSTVLFLMFLNGELGEKLDFAICADTQEEPETVYKHLDWLKALGSPPCLGRTAPPPRPPGAGPAPRQVGVGRVSVSSGS